jgi:predicted DNA-binding transcriptional regulator AlpA
MRLVPPEDLPIKYGVKFSNPHRIQMESEGRFPKRVKVGQRKYGYIDDEMDAWLKARAALREIATA